MKKGQFKIIFFFSTFCSFEIIMVDEKFKNFEIFFVYILSLK